MPPPPDTPARRPPRAAKRGSGEDRPRLLSGPFWLMMALAALSLAAALVVGTLGPRLFPPRPMPPPIAAQAAAPRAPGR